METEQERARQIVEMSAEEHIEAAARFMVLAMDAPLDLKPWRAGMAQAHATMAVAKGGRQP
jgi:hypothetical protein